MKFSLRSIRPLVATFILAVAIGLAGCTDSMIGNEDAFQVDQIPGRWVKATYWQAVVPLILEKVDKEDFESFEKS